MDNFIFNYYYSQTLYYNEDFSHKTNAYYEIKKAFKRRNEKDRRWHEQNNLDMHFDQ